MTYDSYCTQGLVLRFKIGKSRSDILAKELHRSDSSLVKADLISNTTCQEMHDTSTLILAEEKKNLFKKANDTSKHTIQRYFTLETLNWENQHSFECSSILLSYSIKIKGYMSNLGPHLRHNRHHTIVHRQEQPCNKTGLHMHDQQPTLTHALTCKSAFYDHLKTTAFTALQHASL